MTTSRLRATPLLLAALLTLSSCGKLFSPLDSPMDPKSGSYQGFETVSDVDALSLSYPTDGGTMGGVTMTVAKVIGATAYELVLTTSEDGLDTSPLFQKADYETNLLDISSSGMQDQTEYWWKARAKASSGNWGGWTSVASFTTDWTTAAETPTFSPEGGTYTSDQSVTLSCATAGSTIHYTTNGDPTTAASTLYAGAISVAGHGTEMTIMAIAVAMGYSSSETGSASYTIAYPAAATPTFSPAGGTYTVDQSVTLSCATAGSTIHYTTNGDPPTAASAEYTGAISVAGNGTEMTVKAIAVATGYSSSATGSATYTIAYIIMLPVAGGSFYNGTSTVTLSSFAMSKYEVTQAQYTTVTGNSPSSFTGDTSRPVERVTWYDAVEFCNALSTREGLTPVYGITGRTPSTGYPITAATVTATWANDGYRLPTEAQWEFAARGGTGTHGYTYAGSNTIDGVAWYYSNSGSTTHAVGGKTANELGLHDMSGNVWEWCWDWYGSYPSGNQTDPVGAASGTGRVLRGGGCGVNEPGCAVSYRDDYYPNYGSIDFGFRVVRPSSP